VSVATVWAVIAAGEGALAIFMARTWWWVLRRHDAYDGWRRKASVAGLALPTLALVMEVVLAAAIAHHGLGEMDEATMHGWWGSRVADILFISCFFGAGLLPPSGLILAVAGRGNPRFAAFVWSCLVFVSFLPVFLLAVNSFH
jgi:hypothetical protein